MSAETKWTPGPWDRGQMIGVAGQDEAGLSLGFINTHRDDYRNECKANARLISTAPDLYEALSSIVELGLSDTALREARAVLAKARGEA